MKNSGIIIMLSNSGYFNSLKDEELELLANHSQIKRVEKHDLLYDFKSKKEHVYIVLRGTIKLEAQTDSGKAIIKDVAYQNDIFGENIFVDHPYRDEYAEAVQDSSILCIETEVFKSVALGNLNFSNDLTHLFLKKVVGLQNRIGVFKETKAKSRIVSFFKELAQNRAVMDKKLGLILNHGLSHLDIARITDTSRQTAARVMNELKRDGLIAFPNRRPRTIIVDKLLSN